MSLAIDTKSHPLKAFSSRCEEAVKVPYALSCEAVKTARAYLFHDIEGTIDGMGKIAGYFDLFISASSATIRGIGYLIIWLKNDVNVGLPRIFSLFVLPFAIIGLVVSLLEIIYECANLVGGIKLRANLNFSKQASKEELLANLETIRKSFLVLNKETATQIGAYIDEKMPCESPDVRRRKFDGIADRAREIQYDNLARRVSPRLAQEIKEDLVRLQADLHCNIEGALERAQALLNDIDIQSSKKILVHAVGLFSLLLSAASYALLLVTFPHVAMVSLGLALGSIVLYVGRYLLDKGLFPQKGWEFSMDACIPEWTKKVATKISNYGIEALKAPHRVILEAIQWLDK